MPKMKSHRGAKKRLKVTATGKVLRGHSGHSHILTKKTTKSKRQRRGSAEIHSTNMDSVRAMMPFA